MNLDTLIQSTKKFKVLYVEDSATIRRITKILLSEFFDTVDVAKDGREALDRYHKYYNKHEKFYDIVFTDLEMPNMDGKKLSELLLDFNFSQEIVVISSVDDFKKVVELINTGVKKFISKPVENEQLARVISEVLQSLRKKQLLEDENRERQEYNSILKIREEKYKNILEAKVKELEEFGHALEVSAIVAKTDIKGVLTYVNEHFCNLSGYSKEELIGTTNSIVNSGSRSSTFYQKLWNTISNKRTYKTLFENRRKDGSIYYIETTITPILDISGDIIEFIAVSHDMTQLMKSLEKTKQAQKSKENFFINMSHEMKTPLNSILGFSSLLKKRVKDDEKSLMMVETISETGNDLKNIVESIIDMRKIKERTLVLNEREFNPKEELTKCLDKYAQKAEKKNQEYMRLLDKSIPDSLVGDSSRIMQVISVILDNAVKFTHNGGKIQTTLSYDKFTNILLCEIKDNGIGIEKENQKLIFGLEQLDATASRSYEGAGLGLSIASSLIDIMKGSLTLKSIPNKGTMFNIEFPMSA